MMIQSKVSPAGNTPEGAANAKPCMRTPEITKRFFYILSCIIVLITSAITLSIIYQVESTLHERDVVYKGADGYKAAVWCLVCLGSAGIVYHIIMMPLHCLYLITGGNKHYKLYLLMNALLCVLFALGLLAGGVVNALYSANDHELSPDICITTFGRLNDEDEKICTKILQIRIFEGVSAGLSFLSTFAFGSLLVTILGSWPRNNKVNISNVENVPSPQDTSLHPSQPPPPYTSISPPSYESTVAPL